MMNEKYKHTIEKERKTEYNMRNDQKSITK
jgi:hypothetical protein